MVIIIAGLLVAAVLGGLFGWRNGTALVMAPPELENFPIGTSAQEHRKALRARYRLRRLLLAAGWALVTSGALLAALMLFALVRR